MFKLFNRGKNPIDRLSFNHFGWKLRDNTRVLKSWVKNGQTAFVGAEYCETSYINLNTTVDELVNKVRMEVVNRSNGGIIGGTSFDLNNHKIFQIITKEPQTSSGMSYIGQLIIPTQKGHYTIMLKLFEMGATGIRESVVFTKWLELNPDIKADDNGKIIGWFNDPFDNNFREGTPMSYAEHKDFDKEFPEHPLSELREKINLIRDSLNISS